MVIQSPLVSTCSDLASVVGRAGTRFVRGVAFWTAAILPLVYLPLVFLGGLGPVSPWSLVKLIALNVVALIVGHGYGNRDGE